MSGTRALEGRYANYFEVGHNEFEFVLNFGQLFEDSEDSDLHTKIITGPTYAKRLQQVLGEAIRAYEGVFGVIPE